MKKLHNIECIFERVYIETPVDTDGDGKLDLVAAFIKRPVSTLQGEKIPAVFVANPYLMTCNEDGYAPHDVDREVLVYPEQNIKEEDIRYDFSKEPEYEVKFPRVTCGEAETSIVNEDDFEFECISELYGYLNQKGYASVFCGGLGTLGSEGYTLTGSREEIMAFKAVIDWLNGRCRAFTNKTDNIEIKADWCTGKVAMSAKSYLGTMCIGVAATGVEGLETIIPEAGISSWYDYYRCNGLNLPAIGWQGDDLDTLAKYCFSREKDPEDYTTVKDGYAAAAAQLTEGQDRASANYNRFWDERNYLNQVENIKASVFIIHGINDWNVKTNQCCPLFEKLQELGVERKMLLHQGEHVYVYDLKGSGTLDMVERWLDHYLKGVDNGIKNEPKVLVESNLDQEKWFASETWPPENMEYVKFPVSDEFVGGAADGNNAAASTAENTAVIVDDLNATVYDREKDNQAEWLDQLVLTDSANAVRVEWDPFADEMLGSDCGPTAGQAMAPRDLRISGTVKVAFDAAIDRGTAILSAALADLGEDHRITAEELPVEGSEDGTFRFGLEAEPSKYKIISRGWLNAQNRTCNWSKEHIEPGKKYRYEFDMVPTDHQLKTGHKLALILYGIDVQATQRPDTVTHITIDMDSVDVKVPVVK